MVSIAQILISKFVTDFFKNIYTSVFNKDNCNNFIKKVQAHIPIIDNDFKAFCDSDVTTEEVRIALLSMKKGNLQATMD